MVETIKNLATAFIGESMARNRYTYFAATAKKEGYEQLAAVFIETAEQESQHAKWLLRMINSIQKLKNINQDEIIAEGNVMPVVFNSTAENLKAAIAGENHEYTKMYPEFADVAEKEGYPDIAERIRAIAIAEKHHEDRYKKFLKEIEAGTLLKKSKKTVWICRKCGYLHEGTEPPENCPACNHPPGYYQIQDENY